MRDDQPLGVVGTHQHATTRGTFGPLGPSTSTSGITGVSRHEVVYLVSTRQGRDGGKDLLMKNPSRSCLGSLFSREMEFEGF